MSFNSFSAMNRPNQTLYRKKGPNIINPHHFDFPQFGNRLSWVVVPLAITNPMQGHREDYPWTAMYVSHQSFSIVYLSD